MNIVPNTLVRWDLDYHTAVHNFVFGGIVKYDVIKVIPYVSKKEKITVC